MAANLKLVFDGSDGKKVSFSFPHADYDAPASQVKTLMQIIVANGDIYSEVPQSLSKAEFFISEVRPVNIS